MVVKFDRILLFVDGFRFFGRLIFRSRLSGLLILIASDHGDDENDDNAYDGNAADCCEDADAVAAFDATFPPQEKQWMPSQEEFYIYSHSSVVR